MLEFMICLRAASNNVTQVGHVFIIQLWCSICSMIQLEFQNRKETQVREAETGLLQFVVSGSSRQWYTQITDFETVNIVIIHSVRMMVYNS